MARSAKVRIVAFLPPALADQYTGLSTRFGLSRSELVRLVMQRGYRSLATWCEQQRSDFEVAPPAPSAPPAPPAPPAPVQAEAPMSSPSTMLTDFCSVLVDQDPDIGIDQVRAMATAQATVFGVGADEVDELVAAELEKLFPSALPGDDDGSGSVGGDLD